MANLTYNIYSGMLVVQAGSETLMAFCHSGGSNLWSDSQQKQQGAHGSAGHVHGGPIPPGRWRVHRPGSPLTPTASSDRDPSSSRKRRCGSR